MCLSIKPALFKVLSQRLHWIEQLFLFIWTFKWSSLVNKAGQFSQLYVFSPKHCFMWLVLLLYKIFFPQCLQVTVMWVRMCILDLVLHTFHKTAHDHHALFLCASSDFHQKKLQSYIWLRKTLWSQFILLMMLFVRWIYWYFHTKMRTVSP